MASKTPRKPATSLDKPAAAKSHGTAPVQPGEVPLLSGGNPQIAKGYGDGPVQACIAAMPGWK
ncbi:MAG: DUF1801 domain-containing protein, partial [Ensifer adhaerens]